MDDLFATNNPLEFDKNYKDIYLGDLQLQKKSISTFEVSFLDILITIEEIK